MNEIYMEKKQCGGDHRVAMDEMLDFSLFLAARARITAWRRASELRFDRPSVRSQQVQVLVLMLLVLIVVDVSTTVQ